MKTKSSYKQIDYRQRETITIARQSGSSIRAIARMLDRAPSTISRELARNQPGPHYNCHFAQQRRDRRRVQGRPAPKLAAGTALFEVIVERLRWSPRQIAGYLARLHPLDASMRISRESIYSIIYALPRGEFRRELVACLRMARAKQAFTDKLNSVAPPMRLSLTYDRGKKMAYHQQLTANTSVAVYFCDPHSPWQRGSNENMNGLVRQYLPKGSDLSSYTHEQLGAIADEINGRPRRTLDWACPLEVYDAWIARLSAQPDAIQ